MSYKQLIDIKEIYAKPNYYLGCVVTLNCVIKSIRMSRKTLGFLEVNNGINTEHMTLILNTKFMDDYNGSYFDDIVTGSTINVTGQIIKNEAFEKQYVMQIHQYEVV